MKNCIIVLLLILPFNSGFSQDITYELPESYSHSVGREMPSSEFAQNLRYDIRGAYTRPVIKEKLSAARFLHEISPGYPSTWLSDSISAEILATIGGRSLRAVSESDILSPEQKSILNSADIGDDIVINVRYKYRNSVTDKLENRAMNYSVTVVPEIEGKFPGEKQEMDSYFNKNAMSKISETSSKEFKELLIKFTVNEEGEIVNAHISKKSGDPKIDKLFLDTIIRMPKWKPAENSKGKKVKQEFEFIVGSGGC